jgi:membrane protein DedA with SNARE-associated domain
MVTEHGALAVLAGRFFVGFRAPVFMAAGAMRLPVRQFLRWDFAGLLVTVPAVLGLGYAFGAPLLETTRWALAQTRWLAIAIAVAGGLWAWQRRGRLASPSAEGTAAGDPEEV